MRDDIRELVQWKGGKPRTETRIHCWTSSPHQSKSRSTQPVSLPVAALDAAFEDVDLNSDIPHPHRVDQGTSIGDPNELFVEKLVVQLSVLEAQCRHLQGLLNSAKH